MKKQTREMLREETGTFTVEAAFIVPIVILLICAMLFGTLLTFRSACGEIAGLKVQNEAVVRNPGQVIRNTDLAMDYLERLQHALEGES